MRKHLQLIEDGYRSAADEFVEGLADSYGEMGGALTQFLGSFGGSANDFDGTAADLLADMVGEYMAQMA